MTSTKDVLNLIRAKDQRDAEHADNPIGYRLGMFHAMLDPTKLGDMMSVVCRGARIEIPEQVWPLPKADPDLSMYARFAAFCAQHYPPLVERFTELEEEGWTLQVTGLLEGSTAYLAITIPEPK